MSQPGDQVIIDAAAVEHVGDFGHRAGLAIREPLAGHKAPVAQGIEGRVVDRSDGLEVEHDDGHLRPLGDGQDGMREGVGRYIEEYRLDAFPCEAFARGAGLVGVVDQPHVHDFGAQLGEPLGDIALVPEEPLPETRELGPVGIEAYPEQSDLRAGSSHLDDYPTRIRKCEWIILSMGCIKLAGRKVKADIYKAMLLPETDAKNSFFRYLTYSEEDEKWQLVCTDAGHNEIGPYTAYPPYKKGHPGPFKSVAVGRTLNEYQIIYITKGQGSFETGGKSFAVAAGRDHDALPGCRPCLQARITKSAGPSIGWDLRGPYADHLRREGFLSPDRPFYDVGLRNGLLAAFTEIFELVREQEPLYQIRASSLVLGLVADILARERKAVQYSHSEQLVQKAKFLMEENIYGEINLGGICEALGVSSSHLNEVFKAYTAMTPYQYFISIKMHKAKELLERGDSAIKEVAFRLGFKDEYYFSRLFKRKAGVSPSRWSEPSRPRPRPGRRRRG